MATIYERKCRSCGYWATSEGLKGSCPKCKAAYGGLSLGMDKIRKLDPAEAVSPKPKKPIGWQEASKLPPPEPGEEGYVPPSPKKGGA